MTLSIHPQRVRLYRALWGRWIIVLRVLFDLGAATHSVKWQAAAQTLMVDKKTILKYIHGLVRDDHLVSAGDGFMLTPAGMAFLRETVGGENPHLEDGKIPGENFSLLKELVVVNDSELRDLTTPPTKEGKIPGENFPPAFYDERIGAALEHLPELFDGSSVTSKGLPTSLHWEKVIGWIAYAYDKRTSLSAPCGLIYSKLVDGREPAPYIKYMERPEDFLPESYLELIGLLAVPCQYCDETFYSRAERDAHQQAAHPYPCMECDAWHATEQEAKAHYDARHNPDRVHEAVRVQGDETLTPLWEQVLSGLRDVVPTASFETWVQSSAAVGADGQALIVGTRNSYARDWLQSRVATQVVQLLPAPFKTVRFVVATETD